MNLKALTILFLCILFNIRAFAQESKSASVTGIEWQNKEQMLSYDLSQESVVKIRAGSYSGPVYRAIVNLQSRMKGQNREQWDGKDEEGKVDFLKYGKVHFCVESSDNLSPDSVADLKFLEGVTEVSGVLQISKLNKILLDIPNTIKPLYNKEGGELRVYLDNKLHNIEVVHSFPVSFSLLVDNIPPGKHLLAINLWPALNFSFVAYKAFEIVVPEKKTPAQESTQGKGFSQNDGSGELAFSQTDKDGFWQIFTSTLQGKDTKQLTKTPVDKRYPSWSPDGKEITYVNNRGELWIINNQNLRNRNVPLPVSCSEPSFSPDGTKILFTSLEDVYHGNTKIWEVDLKTLRLKKIAVRPWLQYNPGYSPDGSQILFTDGPELFGQNIYKLDLQNNNLTQITDNGAYEYDMQAVFLNSGQEVIYSTNEGNGDYEIYKMDKFGRDKVNLSCNSASADIMPKVSKNRDKIFFLSDRNGNFAVWQMNTDGSEAKQITYNKTGISSFSIFKE
jgi:dipeptidyl aminopeptidase/acylaminoacyl peptidase